MRRPLLLVALALAALAAGDDIPWDSHREKAKAREAYQAKGITAAQRAELDNMLESIADLVAEQDARPKAGDDLYAFDNLKLLHGKLAFSSMEAWVMRYGSSARLSYPPRDSARVTTWEG